MTAGYSGTPLVKKLGIKAGSIVAVLNDPGHFAELVDPLPAGVTVRSTIRGKADIVVFFTKRAAELTGRIDSLGRAIHPDAMLWVCWPKRAAKVPSDMTESVVRAAALERGMVDVKVCAVDETWSGLKVVWRKERR